MKESQEVVDVAMGRRKRRSTIQRTGEVSVSCPEIFHHWQARIGQKPPRQRPFRVTPVRPRRECASCLKRGASGCEAENQGTSVANAYFAALRFVMLSTPALLAQSDTAIAE